MICIITGSSKFMRSSMGTRGCFKQYSSIFNRSKNWWSKNWWSNIHRQYSSFLGGYISCWVHPTAQRSSKKKGSNRNDFFASSRSSNSALQPWTSPTITKRPGVWLQVSTLLHYIIYILLYLSYVIYIYAYYVSIICYYHFWVVLNGSTEFESALWCPWWWDFHTCGLRI